VLYLFSRRKLKRVCPRFYHAPLSSMPRKTLRRALEVAREAAQTHLESASQAQKVFVNAIQKMDPRNASVIEVAKYLLPLLGQPIEQFVRLGVALNTLFGGLDGISYALELVEAFTSILFFSILGSGGMKILLGRKVEISPSIVVLSSIIGMKMQTRFPSKRFQNHGITWALIVVIVLSWYNDRIARKRPEDES